MPLEFKDLTKDVSKGARIVGDSLDDMIDAVDEADKVLAALGKREKAALEISKKFVKANLEIVKCLSSINKTSILTVKSIFSLGKTSDKSAASIQRLRGTFKATNTVMAGTVKNVVLLNKHLKEIQTKKLIAAPEKSLKAYGVAFKIATQRLKEYYAVAKKLSKQSLAPSMIRGEPRTPSSVSRTASPPPIRRRSQEEDEYDYYDRMSSGGSIYNDTMKQSVGIMKMLKAAFQEGAWEAKRFGDGVGVSSGLLIGAGAAAVYLSQKVSSLLDEYESARMSLAKYRIETDMASKTTLGFGGTSLSKLKTSLNLTKGQAEEFFKVVRQGTNELGITPNRIFEISKALQNTFGGDPTERLKDYISLLKEIPTLETDLKITASLDDQTAALFALAQSGKMESVIEFQAAGLAGGAIGAQKATSPEVKMLNAQQQAMSMTEKINDTMLNYYQEWGPQFSAIVDVGTKAVSAIGGLVAIAGAVKLFLGLGIPAAVAKTSAATGAAAFTVATAVAAGAASTVAAIHTQGLMGGGGIGGKVLRGASSAPTVMRGPKGRFMAIPKTAVPPPFVKEAKAAAGPFKALTGEVQAAGKSVVGFGRGIDVAGRAASIWSKVPKGPIVVTAAMLAAGVAANYLAEKMDKTGASTAASLTRVGVAAVGTGLSLYSMTAFGAAIGSFVPLVGSAIGAVAGFTAGLLLSAGSLGSALQDAGKLYTDEYMVGGKIMQKYTTEAQAAGQALEVLGGTFKEMPGVFSDGVSELGGMAGDVSEKLRSWGKGLGVPLDTIVATLISPALGSFAKFGELTDTYNPAIVKLTTEARSLLLSYEGVRKEMEEYRKTITEIQSAASKSALAYQQQSSKIESALKSSAMKLNEFEARVSEIDLSALTTLGGTAEAFERALRSSTSTATSSFKMAAEIARKGREDLSKDLTIQADLRKSQLLRIHEIELNAAMDYADKMMEIVNAMLKTPEIIKTGLEMELRSTRIEQGLQAGGVGGERAREFQKSQIESITKLQQEAFMAYAVLIEKKKELDATSAEQEIKNKENLAKAVLTLDAAQKKELIERGAIAEKDGKIVAGAGAADAVKEYDKELDAQKNKYDELAKDNPSAEILQIAGSFNKLTADLKEARNNINQASLDFSAAGEDEKKKDEAKALGKQASEDEARLTKIRAEAMDKGMAFLKAQGLSDAERTPEGISQDTEKFFQAIGPDTDFQKLENKLVTTGIGGLNKEGAEKTRKVMEEGKDVAKDLQKIQDQRTKLEIMGAIAAEASLSPANQEIAITKQVLKIAADLRGYQEKGIRLRQEISEIMTKEVADATNKLTLDQGIQAAAEASGDYVSGTINAITSEQNLRKVKLEQDRKALDKAEEQLNLDKEAVDGAKINLAQAEAKLKGLERLNDSSEASKKKIEAQKLIVGALQGVLDGLSGEWQATNETVSNIKKRTGDLLKEARGIFDTFTEMEKSISVTPLAKMRAGMMKYADTLREFAVISGDISGTLARVSATTRKAAEEEYAAQTSPKGMKEARETAEKNVQARIDMVTDSVTKARLQASKQEMIAAEEATHNAQVRLNYENAIMADAKSRAEIENKVINMEQAAVDDQISFLNEIGGSFGTIMDLAAKSLSYERQKLSVLQEEYETAKQINANSLETRDLELQIDAQKLAIARKAMGAQKSAMERMMGMIMGELRSNVGAARHKMTDIGILGVKNTRVKTREGMYAEAKPGEVKSIAARAFDIQNQSWEELQKGGKLSPEKTEAKRMQLEESIAKDMGRAANGIDRLVQNSGGGGAGVGGVAGVGAQQQPVIDAAQGKDVKKGILQDKKNIAETKKHNIIQDKAAKASGLTKAEYFSGRGTQMGGTGAKSFEGRGGQMTSRGLPVTGKGGKLSADGVTGKGGAQATWVERRGGLKGASAQDTTIDDQISKLEEKRKRRTESGEILYGEQYQISKEVAKLRGKKYGISEEAFMGEGNVPFAATGGFVEKTGMAVIHEGETVTPPQGRAGAGNNEPMQIHVIVSGDARVKFDTKMLEDTIIPLVAKNMAGPLLGRSLGQAGVMRFPPG